jgi:uncharacterized protein
MGSEQYHEPFELISEATRNLHRAVVTLIEELEAVDWYQQRADACTDEELVSVLIHNKNEEIEHAMMTLEWIRRHNRTFDEMARTYLFTEAPIVLVEQSTPPATVSPREGSLGIGSLKGAS